MHRLVAVLVISLALAAVSTGFAQTAAPTLYQTDDGRIWVAADGVVHQVTPLRSTFQALGAFTQGEPWTDGQLRIAGVGTPSVQANSTITPRQAAEAMRACLAITSINQGDFFKPEFQTVDVQVSDAPTFQVNNTNPNVRPSTYTLTDWFMVTGEGVVNMASHRHEPDSRGVMLAFRRYLLSEQIAETDLAAIQAFRGRVAVCFDQTYPWGP